ncbi:MAG TPA: hypothetical protein VNF50_00330 [Acidimicrobiales bacterium]|nr:hypothetical protein [Acidimicrobiales bacterium]
MSDLNDYPDEMRKPRALDDRAVEAFFAGRNLPADEELLGAFAQSVRAFSHQPAPTPRGELAAVLMNGLTIEKGDLPVTAVSNVTGPQLEASGLPKWRRPRMTVSALLSALMTKLGALGLAAKAGLLIALTAAGVTAAGAAGALPAPVQNVVSHAVSDVTPFSLPTTANSHAAFGAKTSTAAHHHGVSGSAVSKAAKAKGSTDGANPTTGGSNAATTGGSNAGNAASGNAATTGPPTHPGSQSSTGLNRANTTPAKGHAPTSVPTPTNPGSQSGSHPSGAPTSPGSQSGSNPGSGARP